MSDQIYADRAAAFAECANIGMTQRQACESLGICRNTLSRHAKKYGVKFRNAAIKPDSQKSVFKIKANEKCLSKYGCTWEQYKQLRDFGVFDGQRPKYCKRPVRAFDRQRRQAARRGIEWKIKLWDWWQIWDRSGKWDSRGKRVGEYVMCRFMDEGSYEVGNVYIDTASHNTSFQPKHPRVKAVRSRMGGAA